MILKIVEEEEPAFSASADCKTQSFSILRIDQRGAFREHGLHVTESVLKCAAEEMDRLQPAIGLPDLSELPDGCLIVIGDLRSLCLIQEHSVLPLRIGAAVEDIVSEKIAPGGQLDICHGIHALEWQYETVIVSAGHAAAHLTAGVGAVLRQI